MLKTVTRLGEDEGVEVVLANGEAPAADEADERETQTFSWSRDAEQPVRDFALMVRGEIQAHLSELNAPPARVDVTAIYQQYLQQ